MSGNPSSDQPPFQRKKLKRGLTQEQIDSLGPLTFGFDIGIASVGWAVLSETRIVDLGVRCFDAAEDPKTGESLGERWRTQKVARRRLHRRVDRLKALRRLFVQEGLLAKPDATLLAAPPTETRQVNLQTPWALRSRGLDERLEPIDWARVLYHLVKRRGFLSTRKAERVERSATTANAKEKQGLLAGVAATARKLMVSVATGHWANWRSSRKRSIWPNETKRAHTAAASTAICCWMRSKRYLTLSASSAIRTLQTVFMGKSASC